MLNGNKKGKTIFVMNKYGFILSENMCLVFSTRKKHICCALDIYMVYIEQCEI
jgi:hypothetical protein